AVRRFVAVHRGLVAQAPVAIVGWAGGEQVEVGQVDGGDIHDRGSIPRAGSRRDGERALDHGEQARDRVGPALVGDPHDRGAQVDHVVGVHVVTYDAGRGRIAVEAPAGLVHRVA